jgi:UPF0755 protein
LKHKFLQILLLIILTISIFIGPYSSFLNIKIYSESISIDVERGSSNFQILSNFIVDPGFVETIFIKLFLSLNPSNYQSGEYQVANKSIIDLHKQLTLGNTITHEITIVPGMNKYDINEIVNNSFLKNDCMFLNCLQSKYKFTEGLILPDTYYYKKGMRASTLFNRSSADLIKYVESIWKTKPLTNPLKSPEDSLILASIIEKEAGNDFEKNKIAGVFLKRLKINMRLQADPTIIYGLLPNFDGDIKKSNIKDKKNPYNTYVIKSLPPTPIAVSSKSSIEASILSEPGEYLFFVANKKGSHYFSKTYNEHLEAVKLYQLK